MTIDEAADWLTQQLLDAGVDFARPNPALVWEVFKRFATEPIEGETTELWFEAADGDPDRDSPASFDFVRLITQYTECAEYGEQITATFTASPAVQLGMGRGNVIPAADVAALKEWFDAVEASAPFRVGLRFPGWSFEVRID